MKSPPPF
jgi:hypothetical protein